MSYYFELDGNTLWDAGSHSGLLYASLVQGASEFLGQPSGLTANQQGGCDVDLPEFRALVEGLYNTYSSTGNPVLGGLTRSLLVTSLVLLEQAGAPILLMPEHEEALREEKAIFARAMG